MGIFTKENLKKGFNVGKSVVSKGLDFISKGGKIAGNVAEASSVLGGPEVELMGQAASMVGTLAKGLSNRLQGKGNVMNTIKNLGIDLIPMSGIAESVKSVLPDKMNIMNPTKMLTSIMPTEDYVIPDEEVNTGGNDVLSGIKRMVSSGENFINKKKKIQGFEL